MTTTSIKKGLNSARTYISKESYEIQKTKSFEDMSNEVLDKIITLKAWLHERSSSILRIVDVLEKLTWLAENPSEEILQEINSILDECRGVHSRFSKTRSQMEGAEILEICPEAAQSFFCDIDLFEETIDDVEAVYFRLPHNKEFIDICQKFSELN